MTITQINETDRVTIKISGWLDVQTSQQLEEKLQQLPAVQNLVYDFSELEYISSAGVRQILAAYRRQKENGNNFEVVHVSPEVMEVLEMTGIRNRIHIS